MSDATHASAEGHLEMLEAMTRCAFELGQVAARMARQAEGDWKRFAAASAEFRQLAFALRMGVRLIQRLKAAIPLTPLRTEPAAETPERERAEAAPGRERPDWRAETERERDRSEPVSLPQFLKSLGLAAAAAERRKDELPPEIRNTTLPRLQALLAQANADLAPAPQAQPRRASPAQPTGTLAPARPTTPQPPPNKARRLGGAFTPRPPPLRRSDSG